MPGHRGHSIDFKRQVVAEHHAGETLRALGRRHDLSRDLIRIWVEKAEARVARPGPGVGRAAERVRGADRGSSGWPAARRWGSGFKRGLGEARDRRDARLHPRPPAPRPLHRAGARADGTASLDLLRGAPGEAVRCRDRRKNPRHHRGLRAPRPPPRRRRARHRGHVVNARKVRRPMREHDLTPRRGRRFTRATDSDRDGPAFPFAARDFEVHRPDQLWVADLTHVAIATGFVYLAVLLDAWARRVVGRAIGRSARRAVAALERGWRCAARRPAASSTPSAARTTPRRSIALLAARGLDEPPRQPIRQPEGRELHEDPQGRGRPPHRARHLRRRRRRPSPLHRRRLQRKTTPLRPGLSQPHPVRATQRPHPRQNRRPILSSGGGALQGLPNPCHACDSASRIRAQDRTPLWKLVRSYFSFGLWMRSSPSAKPTRITSSPSLSLNSVLTGIDPPAPI